MNNIELMVKSLKGLWVGDCIGNVGQFYYAQDILKALDEGIAKFGIDNIDPMGKSFQYSDDTEEAIVLVNHLFNNKKILQDKLAMEWATRYYTRDPDGEIYGYGLMTRKVLKDIYEGKPWREANLTFQRGESPSNIDVLIGDIAHGKSVKDALSELRKDGSQKFLPQKVGSCGNGSAMRIPPLGAYFYLSPIEEVVKQATLSAEPTHCHPEGIAGAIAIASLAKCISLSEWVYKSEKVLNTNYVTDMDTKKIYDYILEFIPDSQVKKGILKAKELPLDIPLMKLIEILGNGTYVTCQDTVPLCVFLTIQALSLYPLDEMYEKVLIDTCKCFGDVDTNCAIVGGMIGIISSPPEKWIRYCQPMEGVMGDPLPEITTQRKRTEYNVNKDAIKDILNNIKEK
jgi:ADP-ribosylglycohydrolase